MTLTQLFGTLSVAIKRHKHTLAERVNIIAAGSRADEKGMRKLLEELTGEKAKQVNADHPMAPKIIIE